MRYLLDANVISNIVKPLPSDPLIAWMAEQADQDLFHRFTRGGHVRIRRGTGRHHARTRSGGSTRSISPRRAS